MGYPLTALLRVWYGAFERSRSTRRHVPAVILNALAGNDISVYGKVGNEVKNIDLVRMICKYLGAMPPQGHFLRDQITFVTDCPGHDMRNAIDPTRIRDELDWRPPVTLEQGPEKTVRWHRDNKDWWRTF